MAISDSQDCMLPLLELLADGRIERKIVLIDRRLARLTIEHGVGVATTRTFVVKRLNSGYF